MDSPLIFMREIMTKHFLPSTQHSKRKSLLEKSQALNEKLHWADWQETPKSWQTLIKNSQTLKALKNSMESEYCYYKHVLFLPIVPRMGWTLSRKRTRTGTWYCCFTSVQKCHQCFFWGRSRGGPNNNKNSPKKPLTPQMKLIVETVFVLAAFIQQVRHFQSVKTSSGS